MLLESDPFPAVFAAKVLEPKDALFASGTAQDVSVSVAIQVHRLGIDGSRHFGQNVLSPAVAIERVVGNFKPGDLGQRFGLDSFFVTIGGLIGGNGLQLAVAVQISKENTIESAAALRDIRDDTRPAPAPHNATWVLQIEQVAFLASHDGVGKPVAVQVADRDIFGVARFGALGE